MYPRPGEYPHPYGVAHYPMHAPHPAMMAGGRPPSGKRDLPGRRSFLTRLAGRDILCPLFILLCLFLELTSRNDHGGDMKKSRECTNAAGTGVKRLMAL